MCGCVIDIIFVVVLAVLKKNYTRLCQCLPQDYMNTVNKIKQLLRLSDDVLSNLTNLPTADLINENIIVLLMTGIKSDIDALQFCDIMESLMDRKSSTDIEILRNGKCRCTIHDLCMYKHYIVQITWHECVAHVNVMPIQKLL